MGPEVEESQASVLASLPWRPWPSSPTGSRWCAGTLKRSAAWIPGECCGPFWKKAGQNHRQEGRPGKAAGLRHFQEVPGGLRFKGPLRASHPKGPGCAGTRFDGRSSAFGGRREGEAPAKQSPKRRRYRRRKPMNPLPRLQKVLAEMGLASRRQAEEMIRHGRVMVNGRRPGLAKRSIHPVIISKWTGESSPFLREMYLLLHKPKNTVTTGRTPRAGLPSWVW